MYFVIKACWEPIGDTMSIGPLWQPDLIVVLACIGPMFIIWFLLGLVAKLPVPGLPLASTASSTFKTKVCEPEGALFAGIWVILPLLGIIWNDGKPLPPVGLPETIDHFKPNWFSEVLALPFTAVVSWLGIGLPSSSTVILIVGKVLCVNVGATFSNLTFDIVNSGVAPGAKVDVESTSIVIKKL